MHPFYHPTSMVVVDDDPMFLASFDFYFGDSLLCHAFTDPRRALEFMGTRRPHLHSARSYVEPNVEGGTFRLDNGVALNPTSFSRLMGDAHRFDQVSVAIVDYDMPVMTGLELCRRMKCMPVRTILLTGKAGKDAAVAAFNEQVIDCFLTKQDANLATRLRAEVARLQRSYFAEMTGEIKVMCAIDEARFLSDLVFSEVFEAVLASEDVQEYYLTVDPLGLLLVRGCGAPLFMLVMDEAKVQAHIEIAIEEGAPPELICRLEEGEILPLFQTDSGFYERGMCSSWRRSVWPSRIVRGEETWRYALVDTKGLERDICAKITTYADYRRQRHN